MGPQIPQSLGDRLQVQCQATTSGVAATVAHSIVAPPGGGIPLIGTLDLVFGPLIAGDVKVTNRRSQEERRKWSSIFHGARNELQFGQILFDSPKRYSVQALVSQCRRSFPKSVLQSRGMDHPSGQHNISPFRPQPPCCRRCCPRPNRVDIFVRLGEERVAVLSQLLLPRRFVPQHGLDEFFSFIKGVSVDQKETTECIDIDGVIGLSDSQFLG